MIIGFANKKIEKITEINPKEIATKRPAQIIENSSLEAAKNAWNTLSADEKITYERSANAAVSTIFALEPLIVEDGDDMLELFIQPDQAGQDGDVRDILIIRRDIQWEIGLSIKHNHFAVKHSRLGKSLDFGDRWFGVPCSQDYWDEIRPIFTYIDQEKQANKKWSELPSKAEDVYIPLLNAFVNEINKIKILGLYS